MKKLYLLLIMMLAILCITACSTEPAADVDVNPESIKLNAVDGLNEQIHLNVTVSDKDDITVYYKASNAEEYSILDRELMLSGESGVDCYILGLAKGMYDVKIEQGDGDNFARKIVTGIDVEKQDRSGYAHFKREEGIGGYNNDGTVKEGAKILYLTNENKNTITLDIDGTTYTGLVAILQANQYMEEPLIIRVTDTITTNQWEKSEPEPRYADDSNLTDDYFENTLTKNGENIVGLLIEIQDAREDKIFKYVTTADGFEFLNESELLLSSNTQTHTDGREIYSDGLDTNKLLVEYASNITIEGVGENAVFYQFGIIFDYSDSIELKNITFSDPPTMALAMQGNVSWGTPIEHGGYWIHNNTFGKPYYAWKVDRYIGPDESIYMMDLGDITISYNKFVQNRKSILLGGWEYDTLVDVTIHHNYFLESIQRTPLCRNANVHFYNNYLLNCGKCISSRSNCYIFSEFNYFDSPNAYYLYGSESAGAVKSYKDIYTYSSGLEHMTYTSDREKYVENTCKPDHVTDYSSFDTDPELFYYDAENKCSDVDILLTAEEVPEFVEKYAGAGIYLRLDIQ